MPAAGKLARLDQIAVRKQDRSLGFVGLNAGRIDGHDVRPIREIGDAAEAFRLALRAVIAAAAIKAGQLGVGCGIDQRLYFERARAVRWLRDDELLGRRDIAVGIERRPVELEGEQRQPVAIQRQRGRSFFRIWPQLQPGTHLGLRRVQ